MAHYEVEVEYSQVITQVDWVVVEAEDEEEAQALAEDEFSEFEDVYVIGVIPLDGDE